MTAARLASLGFDGPDNALEGGRAFFEAFGGGYAADKIVGRLGNPCAIIDPGTSVKPYPSGVVGHPGMDAMRKLVTEHDIDPDQVTRIAVKTGPNVIAPGPLRIRHAATALEAKFCVPFQMAAIVLRRKAGLEEFSDSFVQSAACQGLQRKVEAVVDPAIEALGKDRIVFDIELQTVDGRRISQRSEEFYRGGPKNPLTWEELCAKFRDCADATLDAPSQDRFLDLVLGFEDLGDLSALVGAVAK